jgi:TRAP transporter 4TM/12TM fusion protein
VSVTQTNRLNLNLVGVIALLLGLFHIINVSGALVFSTMVIRIAHLAAILSIAFLSSRYFPESSKVHIMKWPAALLTAGVGVLLLTRWEIIARSGEIQTADFAAGIAVIALVVMAALLFVGRILAGITFLFLLYPYLCQYMPCIFYSRGFSGERIVNFLVHTAQGVYGIPIGVASTYIILFTIYGAFLNQFGAGDFFYKLAKIVTRGLTAASAKSAVLFSTLLGMISGSAAGNVAVTGSFTIPMMKKEGYKPEQAAAIEAVVSTGGQIMPPVMGAAAFIMAEIIGTPYLDIMKAAIVPALLFFISILFVVHLEAVKSGIDSTNNDDAPEQDRSRLIPLLIEGIPFIISFTVLIAMMLLGFTPFKACFWSMISLLATLLLYQHKNLNQFIIDIITAIQNGVMNAVPISIACAAAGIIAGILAVTGLGAKLSTYINVLSFDITILALLLTALMAIILGMGLPTTAAYLILATVIAPALAEMGVPLLTAHMFVFFYGCISTITPPVALASYVAAGIASAEINKVGWLAFRYGSVCYLLPFMFFFSPALLGQDNTLGIIFAAVSAAIGVFCVVVAIVGFLTKELNLGLRFLSFIAGCCLLYQGWLSDITGIILMSGLVFYQIDRNISSEMD